MTRRISMAATLAGLAVVLAGCSEDKAPQPACAAEHLDAGGGCGNGAVSGAIALTGDGPSSRTTVTLVKGGEDVFGNSGEGAREFVVGRVAPGTYALVVHAPGYAMKRVESVHVFAGKTTDVGEVTLEARLPAIFGTILLQGASDHRGTLVSLDEQEQVIGTAADGAFRIDDVEPGAHVIHLRHPGFKDVDVDLVVPEYEDLPFGHEMERLPPSGSLAGQVTRLGTGEALAGVTITVGTDFTTHTGDDGAYALSGIPVGRYEVTASLSGFGKAVATAVEIRKGAESALDFELRADAPYPGRLTGIARRMHAPPGANGGIVVRLEQLDLTTATDAEGSWALDDVTPGSHEITITDPRFPKATLIGVEVKEGVDNRAPNVTLGPARKIADGQSSYAHVFPANHKAVLHFPGDPATYLYDRVNEELEPIFDEPLSVIAVDAEERFATLKGATSLFTLEIETGVIDPVEAPPFGSMVSDRALTLYIGDDGVLYEVRAGWTTAVAHEQLTPTTLLSYGATIDEARGWRVVKVKSARDLEMAVDFQGWALPLGEQVLLGPSPGLLLTVGIRIPPAGDSFTRTLHWGSLGARINLKLSETLGEWRLTDSRSELLLTHWPVAGKWSVGVLDLRMGAIGFQVTGLEPDIAWLSSNLMVAKKQDGAQIVWITAMPPASGVLCNDSPEEAFRTPFYGCLDGTGPARTLRVLDDSGRAAQVYSEDASDASITNLGIVSWRDSDDLLHVRTPWSPTDLSVECSNPSLELAGARASVFARCDGESYVLDFWNDSIVVIGGRPDACSWSEDGANAFCTYPCDGEVCSWLYDFDAGTSYPMITTSSAPRIGWGGDGSLAVDTEIGAFHVKRGDPPLVVDCGLEDVELVKAAPDHSIWRDADALTYVCSSDGSVSDPFFTWGGSAGQPEMVGSSSKIFIGGWLVDLEDGSHTELVQAEPSALSLRFALVVASDQGLLRIPEDGDPEWLVDDERVRAFPFHQRTAFQVLHDAGYDLLIVDAAGEVSMRIEGILEVRPSGVRDVITHGTEDGLSSVTVYDDATRETWKVPFPIVTGEPWVLAGDRLFYDTPTETGVAFVGADIAARSASVLHESASGRAIGPGRKGRWLFVADGWSWEETAGRPRAVLAGEMERLQMASSGSYVFHARSPEVTYWLDSD